MDKIAEARLALSALTVYRGLLDDEVIKGYKQLLEAVNGVDIRGFVDAYSAFFHLLLSKNTVSPVDYFTGKVVYDDNIFARKAASGGHDSIDAEIFKAAENDISLLRRAVLPSDMIKMAACRNFPENAVIINGLPGWRDGELIYRDARSLAEFYVGHGFGIFARYGALRWSGGVLCGVDSPDPVRLFDLKGYEYERKTVVDNTLELLEGSRANNILLYGDRGTGKSSTVKAVGNEYRDRGLRIIEVPKGQVADFAAITRKIAGLPLKFIIFIDDLSFESGGGDYAALKGVLEGGLAARPSNTVIYATSNRRHFVKESFSEREGGDVHAADAMQEKLSLADRFGITVTFTSPDQQLYLKIVKSIAADRGIETDEKALARGAVQWALMYNGRSPRTAAQYVDWVQGRLKSGGSLKI